MQYARKNSPLLDPYTGITLVLDLFQHTILAHKQLVSLTKLLRYHKVTYRWGFTAKLLITQEKGSDTIASVSEGLILAKKKWGLLPEENDVHSAKSSPNHFEIGVLCLSRAQLAAFTCVKVSHGILLSF